MTTGAGCVSVHQFGSTNNAVSVRIGDLVLHFSYETLIAYDDSHDGLVVSRNHWSVTTGKHLNAVDDGNKGGRLGKVEFENSVAKMLKRYGLEEK